jgi:hypothetical protein
MEEEEEQPKVAAVKVYQQSTEEETVHKAREDKVHSVGDDKPFGAVAPPSYGFQTTATGLEAEKSKALWYLI